MKQWLNVDSKTNKVIGYQRNSSNTLPSCPTGMRQVERDNIQMQEYFDLVTQASNEKRIPDITESGGTLILESDTRIYLDITANKNEVLINTETITFTINKLNADDTIDTTFNAVMKFPFNNRLFKVTFVNGVATYSMIFKKSRQRIIDSTKNFKIKTPLIIDVVE